MGKYFFLFCFLCSTTLFAQENARATMPDFSKLGNLPPYYLKAMQSKYNEYIDKDFWVYRFATFNMERNTEFPILVDMKQGRLYHFLIFMDPESAKVEMKLGKEGIGHIVTYRFKPKSTGEFFTEFSFVCPRSGQYLMTLFQRTSKDKPMGSFGLLVKNSKQEDGELMFKN